jgi:hypothetical protein
MAPVIMILMILYNDSSIVKEIEFSSMSACVAAEKVIEEYYSYKKAQQVVGVFCVRRR